MTEEKAKVIVDNFVAGGSVYTLWQFFWSWKEDCILPKKNMLLHFCEWVFEYSSVELFSWNHVLTLLCFILGDRLWDEILTANENEDIPATQPEPTGS